MAAIRSSLTNAGERRMVPVRGYDTHCNAIVSAKFAFETALKIAGAAGITWFSISPAVT